MIKVIAPAQRHPSNRSLEDFHRYWGESHGPLFANTRRLRGYVQHLTLPDAYGRDPDPTFDGVSMFWYDDLASQSIETSDPETQALLAPLYGIRRTSGDAPVQEAPAHDVALQLAVLKDDAQLFDRSATWPMHRKRATVSAEERAVVDGPSEPDMVKAILIASKLPGLTLLEFFDRWEQHRGELVARVPGVRRYVQNHALLDAYAAGVHTHDGWEELWFDDLGSLHAAFASPEWRAVDEAGQQLFAKPLGVGVARERIQKDPRGGWNYRDFGVGEMSDEDIRARLAEQGYSALAADADTPAALRAAAEREALVVWTDEHLVTVDASAIDARPERN